MKRSTAVLLIVGALALPFTTVLADMSDDKPFLLAQVMAQAPAPFDIRGTGGASSAPDPSPLQGSRAPAPARAPLPVPTPALTPLQQTAPARTGAPVAPSATAAGGIGKYLLPMGNMRLSGERSTRSWTIFLTAEQAQTARALQLAYINAIAVMPEVSRLQVRVNDQVVLKTAIASASTPGIVSAPVTPGLLRAGANVIRIEAEQRHRIVCSVDGTYELWTDIDAARSGFIFETGALPTRLQSLDDIAAVGFDSTGRTTLSVVIPGSPDSTTEQQLLQLSQALALRGRFIHSVVSLQNTLPERTRPGELVVVMAPFARLPAEVTSRAPGMPQGMAMNAGMPVNGMPDFIPLRDGGSALLVTGATADDMDRAINSIIPQVARGTDAPAGIDNAAFYDSETPFIAQGGSLTLERLGVDTQEFSGRRFSVSMTVGLPADFYAESYAEARFLLDGGFATALLPNSHFTVTVNGQTASMLALETSSSELLNRMPIRIPMRHFRPGVNVITLEGAFRTAEDDVCAPGTTLSDQPRFALFDTSTLIIPQFARIGTWPNLAAFSARGFPYWYLQDSLRVYLADQEPETIAAAATLVAKLAFGAQRAIPVETAPHINAIQQQDALLIGAADKLPLVALTQAGLARDLRALWAQPVLETPQINTPGTSIYDAVADNFRQRQQPQNPDDIRERWQQSPSGQGGAAGGQENGFDQWLKQTFDLTLDAVLPSWKDAPYSPPNGTSLVLAQGGNPRGNGVWTVMTAGSPAALESAINELTQPDQWELVGGKITAFRQASHNVKVVMPERIHFISTQQPDLFNLRMVAANWLSGNLSFYALVMLAACVLLGVGTYAFLIQLGRR